MANPISFSQCKTCNVKSGELTKNHKFKIESIPKDNLKIDVETVSNRSLMCNESHLIFTDDFKKNLQFWVITTNS